MAVKKPVIIAAAILVLVGLGAIAARGRLNHLPHLVQALSPAKSEPFPQIDTASLDTRQQRLVALLRQEYQSNPSGTKYAQGTAEPWCADFVSWSMRAAGQPLINPVSGAWRIPGTYTMREYYQSQGRFRAPDASYSPKVGDVMFYDNPSPFGQHVNIIIKNDHGLLTTIGGNEPGGIQVYTHKTADKDGFIGYGVF